MARASRESLRTGVTALKGGVMAVWENLGTRVARTAVGVDDNRVCPKTMHTVADLAPPHFCPDADSSSLFSFDSGVQPEKSGPPLSLLSSWCASDHFEQSRDSKTATGSLDVDSASSSGASEESSYARTFNRGMHRRGAGDKLDARQCVYTLHPSSRTSIRPTSLNNPSHVRIPGTSKYVVYHKKGIYQILLVRPNSSLLPRSSIRMAFSTRSESQESRPEPVVESQTNLTPAGRSMENYDRVDLHYMRHGKEFLVGVKGSREDVENIKSRIANFLRTELHLEVTRASHVHIQAGSVLFLGTRVAGLLDNKARRRFSKEIEKRRRSKVRAQGMARVRAETWHNELKDLTVQAWAFGLKKATRNLQSWETVKQVVSKKSQERQGSKFVLEQIDRGVTKDAIQRLLDKEEEVFMDAAGTGLPEQILRAHQRLTKLLKKHLEEEMAFEKKANSARETRSQQAKISRKEDDDDDSIPIHLLAPMEIITEKLSMKGILQPSKALPTVLTPMLNSSDEAIVSYFTALGTCLLSYYRCCDNFEKIRRLVDHQVRWSALFTLGSKHGCSARKIIRQFSRGPKIVDQERSIVVEFPSSLGIARTGKKFLVHVQQNYLDDILRSRRLELLPSSEDKKGPWRTVCRREVQVTR